MILHGEAAPKLFETWLPVFAEKILYLAKREGKFKSSVDGLSPGNTLLLLYSRLSKWCFILLLSGQVTWNSLFCRCFSEMARAKHNLNPNLCKTMPIPNPYV